MRGRRVQKNLNLRLDIVERLEEEDHQAKTVEEALLAYWGESDGD